MINNNITPSTQGKISLRTIDRAFPEKKMPRIARTKSPQTRLSLSTIAVINITLARGKF